jgi:hypothetical protein
MTVTRWAPLWEVQSEMNRLRNEMDRVFGRLGDIGQLALVSDRLPGGELVGR